MLKLKYFTFSPFSENTYILYNEKDCILFDPGCYTQAERDELTSFIESKNLTPIRLINTHCHIDHIFGNAFIYNKYGLLPEYHEGEQPVLEAAQSVAMMYGIPNFQPSPSAQTYLTTDSSISIGDVDLTILFTPGHSPASLSFYSPTYQFIIGGDVLFQQSIGRTDLPGGNYETLMQSITTQFLTLPDQTVVYSGHGQPTTIGSERANNPFIKEYLSKTS